MRSLKRLAAAAVTAGLMTVSIGHADDVGADITKTAKDTGTAISNGAQQVGSSIQQHVAPVGQSIQKGAEDTGAAIHQKADDTGSYLDTATRGFRDGASNFFHSVGNFFSGNSSK